MNVQVVTLPQSQVSLDIEVDSAAIGHAIDRAYQRLAQRYSVPGFRKGKAPRAVLEAAIGRSAVLKEAADIAVNDAYHWALNETGLEPISSPEVSMQTEGLDPSQPLYFSAKLYVRPKVFLGDYKAIRVVQPETPVDDAAVERVLMRTAERDAPWEPIEDRSAELGDMAVITMIGTVDGETVVEQKDDEYLLDSENTADPLNLTPHLTGMNVGEARDFELALPESYQPEQYAGKTMHCHVELRRLEHKTLPVLDDAFAQSIGDYTTLEDLRGRVRRSLEAEQRTSDLDTFVAKVMSQAADAAGVEIPPPLVDEEVDRVVDNVKTSIEGRRLMTFDYYLRLIGKTLENLRAESRDIAERRVKNNLVLETIADAEGLTPDRRQVDAELRGYATMPTVRERERRRILTAPTVRARVEARLKRRLALQRLIEIAHPNSTSDSADKDTVDGATDQLREAAHSFADALEDAVPHPGEEEL